MYINPFLAGVLTTILAETIIIIVIATIISIRRKRGN